MNRIYRMISLSAKPIILFILFILSKTSFTEETSMQSNAHDPITASPDTLDSSEMHMLAPATLQWRSEQQRLQMRQSDAEEWGEVSVVRLFPLSQLEKWLAVVDHEDKEIGMLEDLHGLSRDAVALVRQELNLRYLVPQITRVLDCKSHFDLVEWVVETNRGAKTFLTRNLRENVKTPLPERLCFTDVEGNRYDVPDLSALDPVSRHFIESRV
jgi:hypothetical protein